MSVCFEQRKAMIMKNDLPLQQGDHIEQNFAIWVIFYGKIFSRKNRPMIWANFDHEKIAKN